MPRFNSINFYQLRPKIKLFLPKKKNFFECWGLSPHTLCLRWLGTLPPDHQLPPVVGGSAPRPPQHPSHYKFLAMRLHEKEFTAHYNRPPFILAFGIHVSGMFGEEDVLIHKRCIIQPKVFHPVILIQKNFLKKSFYLHQPTLALAAMRFFLPEHCTLFY